MIEAIVPVKDFASAKQRLDALLSPERRRRLAEAMLRDVLRALCATSGLDLITVVTKEERAITFASASSVSVIREPENRGETEAVALAANILAERNTRSMLVVPGDIPLITSEDVEQVLRAGFSADVVLVPSRDERGTNAVLLTPPLVMPLRFGNDSFHPHLRTARELGLRTEVLHLPNIALDIDTSEDLAALAASPAATQAHALLEEVEWAKHSR